MSFVYPAVLFLLLLLPFAAWALGRSEGARRSTLAEFGTETLLARSSELSNGNDRRIRDILRLIALALAIVAVARPQRGERPSELPRTGRDLLVLLDLSRSMNVGDVAPTRLVAAKHAAMQVVSALPGDRVGLVVFGGSAFLQLPLTEDHETFRLFLDAATSDNLGDPSTDLATALHTALLVFQHEGSQGPRAILLLSDGENQEHGMEKAAEELRHEAIPVFAVGVGTAEGGLVPADSAEAPEKWHRDHIGRLVTSKLEERDLQLAAQGTGGAYVPWSPNQNVGDIPERLAQLGTRTFASAGTTTHADRFQWPLGAAVLLLLLTVVPIFRLNRVQLHPGLVGTTAKAAVILLVLGALSCSRASLAAHRGEQMYDESKWAESYQAFEQALEGGGDRALEYDAGNALYRMHRYDESAKRYRELVGDRAELRALALFNLGNSEVRAAEEANGKEKGELLRQAVAAFEEVLRMNSADTTAKWNLELALQKLGAEEESDGRGRGGRADYGRGRMSDPGYEGNQEAAVGAMAGGGYGSGGDESAKELSEEEARRLLDAVQREQLKTHEGRAARQGSAGGKDW